MARWKPFPIVGGAYKDDARPWSAQDTLNYLVVMAERPGGRSPSLLRGVPGLLAFSLLPAAPVRSLHNAEGLLCAVVGNTFYTIDTRGVAIPRGTIPGVGRVSMAHNQITGGNQIAIANGMSGYVYDTTTGELSHITDEGFPGAISFGFVDGYITGIEPGRRFAFFSQLADATSYNTLDRLEAESKPDRLVGQAISHREWWLFGERTIELYQNTGAATGTFQRSEGVAIEVGCASGYTIVNLDNSIFWLGNDGIVYRMNGYTPERISTHAIEQDISRHNMAQSFACTWMDRGHAVYYLTFPDGHTWGYDAASGEWHRRQSEDMDRWRINDVVRWNNQWIAGDFSNGRLYVMDWNRQDENGAVLERRRTTGVLADSQNAVIVNGLEVVIDTGQPDTATADKPSIKGSIQVKYIGQNVDYQYEVLAASGYSVTVLAGMLPDGLTMDAQGHVTGTITNPGTYSWTLVVTDSNGSSVPLNNAVSIVYNVVSDITFDQDLTTDKTGRQWTLRQYKATNGARETWPQLETETPLFGAGSMQVCSGRDMYEQYNQDSKGYIFSPLGENAPGSEGDFCFELYVKPATGARRGYQTKIMSVACDVNAQPSVITWAPFTGLDTDPTWDFYFFMPISFAYGPAPRRISTTDPTHIALCRKSGTLFLYVAGQLAGKSPDGLGAALDFTSAKNIILGCDTGRLSSTLIFPGWIDAFRATFGWCRYDANFTPPVPPYPDDAT